MNAVQCVGDKFEEMKDVARAEEEEKQAQAAAVMAAAEKARVAHVEQMRETERLAAIEAEGVQKQQEVHEQHLRETDKLGAEKKILSNKLSSLAEEEAELQRKLQSGELSPEQAIAARARLAAIDTERVALQSQFEENNYNSRLTGFDNALQALEDEEAELRRKLASGELSTEEAATIQKRLDEIAKDRED